ncbi:formate dehydrogenase accessory protein FdhE [Janthinobacterium agaricidamnosum]|uniref:Protein FdhE homolog n=1 Tax=Janthinobacterium agaricidamnosum NBRC 102515 = DSM 9628 TaxID=1349767 RepID=W0V520_9BURK|nr:formate dehydrogenase accessory protein FdhE [Janthinobacterium agaricidamnosum]CDG82715.1 formate dehydrogenase accessory protein FdhE [Janthinobacterium agaricidamnosum NBRC 102515 = DSM 9628]
MVQRILQPGEIEGLDHNAIPRLLLPQPGSLFSARAQRLRQLAQGEVAGIPVEASLQGYLLLMAQLAEAQAGVVASLTPDAIPPADAEALSRAARHRMPVLPVSDERAPVWRDILRQILDRLESAAAAQPPLAAVLADLRAQDDRALEAAADAVVAQDAGQVNPLQAPFIAAALQILWSVRASGLRANRVPELDTGTLCPVCGSHPVASVIRIGGQSQGYRYLHCGICESEWHMVRVKCSTCEQNAHIAYQGLDAADAAPFDPSEEVRSKSGNKANDPKKVARAETCEDCHTYRKVFNQEHDLHVEAVADDLASLMLDLLVGEAGYQRASGNPLLWLGTDGA